jgi:circadian clock protein KaiB
MLAIKNIKAICETYLDDSVAIEIVDVIQHPEAAVSAQIIAAPTLIKLEPGPERRLIGDLSNTSKVLAALGINDRVYDAS